MFDLIFKIGFLALIPSAGSVVFNALNHIFNHLGEKRPPLDESAFDISVGCAFTIVGMCITAKQHNTGNTLLFLFVAILLIIIGGELIVPVYFDVSKFTAVAVVNCISFFSLCYSIMLTEQEIRPRLVVPREEQQRQTT